MANSRFDSSNLESIIDRGLKIAANASKLWHDKDYDDKQDLQKLIYPEGIIYNKKKDVVRTPRINSLFASIPHPSRDMDENKKGLSKINFAKSGLVAGAGLEPTTFGL